MPREDKKKERLWKPWRNGRLHIPAQVRHALCSHLHHKTKRQSPVIKQHLCPSLRGHSCQRRPCHHFSDRSPSCRREVRNWRWKHSPFGWQARGPLTVTARQRKRFLCDHTVLCGCRCPDVTSVCSSYTRSHTHQTEPQNLLSQQVFQAVRGRLWFWVWKP